MQRREGVRSSAIRKYHENSRDLQRIMFLPGPHRLKLPKPLLTIMTFASWAEIIDHIRSIRW